MKFFISIRSLFNVSETIYVTETTEKIKHNNVAIFFCSCIVVVGRSSIYFDILSSLGHSTYRWRGYIKGNRQCLICITFICKIQCSFSVSYEDWSFPCARMPAARNASNNSSQIDAYHSNCSFKTETTVNLCLSYRKGCMIDLSPVYCPFF